MRAGGVFSRHPSGEGWLTDESAELKRGLSGDTQNESRKGGAWVGDDDQMVVVQTSWGLKGKKRPDLSVLALRGGMGLRGRYRNWFGSA